MKTILALFLVMMTTLALAQSKASYLIREGKLHKGGSASTEVIEGDLFVVKMSYDIEKKALVPVPSNVLKGEDVIELPVQFKDERGYLELESHGTISLPDATLKFVQRTNIGNLKNAYEILVLPKNGRSRIEVVYHPEIPSAGWARIKVTFISKIPLLNGYQAIMDFKN